MWHFRFGISDFRFQVWDFRLQISDLRFEIWDFSFQVSAFRVQISAFGFLISSSRFQISASGFQISDRRVYWFWGLRFLEILKFWDFLRFLEISWDFLRFLEISCDFLRFFLRFLAIFLEISRGTGNRAVPPAGGTGNPKTWCHRMAVEEIVWEPF